MDLKNKDIELNLLNQDHDHFTNTDPEHKTSLLQDPSTRNDIVNLNNKNSEKDIANINGDLSGKVEDLPNAKISWKDFTSYICPYLTRCVP